jgi:hypothetical protein
MPSSAHATCVGIGTGRVLTCDTRWEKSLNKINRARIRNPAKIYRKLGLSVRVEQTTAIYAASGDPVLTFASSPMR